MEQTGFYERNVGTINVMMIAVIWVVSVPMVSAATISVSTVSHNGMVSSSAFITADGVSTMVAMYPDGTSGDAQVVVGKEYQITMPCGNGEQPESMVFVPVAGRNVVWFVGQAAPTSSIQMYRAVAPTTTNVSAAEPTPTPTQTPTPEPTRGVHVDTSSNHADNGNHIGNNNGVNDDRKNSDKSEKPKKVK